VIVDHELLEAAHAVSLQSNPSRRRFIQQQLAKYRLMVHAANVVNPLRRQRFLRSASAAEALLRSYLPREQPPAA
jgi:hypothetical protein